METLTLVSTNVSSYDEIFNNYINIDKLSSQKFDDLLYIVLDYINKTPNQQLINDVVEHHLAKHKLEDIDKKFMIIMYKLISKSLIKLSNKKFKTARNTNTNKFNISSEIYENIKNEKKYDLRKFTINFFNITLLALSKTYQFDKLTDENRKYIVIDVMNNLITYFYNYYGYVDLDKVIYFNNFLPVYIDNALKLSKTSYSYNIFKKHTAFK